MSDIRILKTGEPDIVEASDGRLTLSVPIQIKRRSGRKLVTLPNGDTAPVRPWDVAPTSIQLALARGHRWLAMLESGEANSLKEIATREGIDNSYVSRMVNLTTLAPDIMTAILDDTLPNHITLFDLAVDPPALWDEQRERVGLCSEAETPPQLNMPLRSLSIRNRWYGSVGLGSNSQDSYHCRAASSLAWTNRQRIPAMSAACAVRSRASLSKDWPRPLR